jgi:LPXTG-motif cell wall-anchored protein
VNNKGSELPTTGGMGTTLFYVLGTVLVLGAGVLLITKKRMKNA